MEGAGFYNKICAQVRDPENIDHAVANIKSIKL